MTLTAEKERKINDGCSNGWKVDDDEYRFKNTKSLYRQFDTEDNANLRFNISLRRVDTLDDSSEYGIYLYIKKWKYGKYAKEILMLKIIRLGPKTYKQAYMRELQKLTKDMDDEYLDGIKMGLIAK